MSTGGTGVREGACPESTCGDAVPTKPPQTPCLREPRHAAPVHEISGTTAIFHRMKLPLWIKPAIGGLFVGLLGLWIKGSIHTGYGWVQISMSHGLMTLPLWTVPALPFAKMIATSFSIGSRGSGGIFGPGTVIGGMPGVAAWRLGDGTLPHMPDSPAPFVIIGMMALFGSIAHAPFAGMLRVAEMTGNLSLLAPAMIAVVVVSALVEDETIYRKQLPDRAHAPMHRIRHSFPLRSALSVRDAMSRVVPGNGTGPVPNAVTLRPETSLDDALQRLADAEATTGVVVEGGQAIGQLTNRDALSAYKAMLSRGVRRARALPPSSMIAEARLGKRSSLAGHTVRDAPLPAGMLVVSIQRTGETIFPRAVTVVQTGDLLTVWAPPGQIAAMHAVLEGRDTGSSG